MQISHFTTFFFKSAAAGSIACMVTVFLFPMAIALAQAPAIPGPPQFPISPNLGGGGVGNPNDSPPIPAPRPTQGSGQPTNTGGTFNGSQDDAIGAGGAQGGAGVVGGGGGQTLATFIGTFVGLVEAAIPIVFTLTALMFFFGAGLFIFNNGNEQSFQKGKSLLFWGVVVLFLMVSIWAIVLIIQDTFGLR